MVGRAGEGDGSSRKPCVSRVIKPMRLYAENGRPVTDRSGVILLSIAGKPLAKVDARNGVYVDQRGRPLTDAANRKPTEGDFDPSTKFPFEKKEDKLPNCHTALFDVSGYPLTDMQGRPLLNRNGTLPIVFSPRGQPSSDLSGGPLLDKMGNDMTKEERPLKDPKGRAYHIFDRLGRPLTDEAGNPLVELSGTKLVVIGTDGAPYKVITGGELFDASGLTHSHPEFDLTKKGRFFSVKDTVRTGSGHVGIAFDKNGHPCTDMAGAPLRFLSGEPMLTHKERWIDWRGEPAMVIRKDIFDQYSLKGFKNRSGVPVRIYDRKGRPLTDFMGSPQNHASGEALIKFDEEGDPVSDISGRGIFDGYGYTQENDNFRPCRGIKSQEVLTKLFSMPKTTIQYFDRFGLPLTNRQGIPLISAKDELMLVYDEGGKPSLDLNGGPIFDILGLPVVCNLENPLAGPQNLPIRLYDWKGRPLTDYTGRCLKNIRGTYLIKYNHSGQIVSDYRNGEVFDKKMRPLSFGIEFNASQSSFVEEKVDIVAKLNGEPLHLYNATGYPLTDANGYLLFDCKGRALIKCPDQGFIVTSDDEPVYDVNGCRCMRSLNEITSRSRAVYDGNGRPLVDQKGNLLQNRKGHNLLMIKHGQPCGVLYGGKCYDSKNIPLDDPRADTTNAPTWETHIIGNGCQLFDSHDLPLTDAFGVGLYTSTGIPLIQIDQNGRPKCDFSGRPIFDKRGVPVTKLSGYWKNQNEKPLRLYSKNGFPLTDLNGKELKDIKFNSLIRQDEVGRPAFDTENNLVNDAKGRCLTSPEFNPTVSPSNKALTLSEKDGGGLRVFDSNGRPLTDESGTILVTSRGQPMLSMKNGLEFLSDHTGKPVYDLYWRPFGCTLHKPILTIYGKPFLLYSKKGDSLTSPDGMPIVKNGNVCSIIFDQYGRPEMSCSGSQLYDTNGNLVKTYKTFFDPRERELESIKASEIYDDQGKPLTDKRGVLISHGGYPLPSKFGLEKSFGPGSKTKKSIFS